MLNPIIIEKKSRTNIHLHSIKISDKYLTGLIISNLRTPKLQSQLIVDIQNTIKFSKKLKNKCTIHILTTNSLHLYSLGVVLGKLSQPLFSGLCLHPSYIVSLPFLITTLISYLFSFSYKKLKC